MEELRASQLCRRCDPKRFDFETTDALAPLEDSLGQPRATAALQFGAGIEHLGYNLFAIGPEGIGKRFAVERFLRSRAKDKATPPDLCYVNNFQEPRKPVALRLPAGRGRDLRSDMKQLAEDLRTLLNATFEGEEYKARRQVIDEEFNTKPEEKFTELRRHAEEKGFAVLRTPMGVVFAPVVEGEVLPPEKFRELPAEERDKISGESTALEKEFQELVQQMPNWERERRNRLRDLNREVTRGAVASLLGELRRKHSDLPAVIDYLKQVEHDIVEHAQELMQPEPTVPAMMGQPSGASGSPSLAAGGPGADRRYEVNVLIDHSQSNTAPVVFEDNPTFANLVGRVEHVAQMGALLTDFHLIRPGALHRANGGYLILEARKLLAQPYAWEGLKRALQAGEIRVESVAEALSLLATVSLEPATFPLEVKVVLLGDPRLYYLLAALDSEFVELFKVEVDFADRISWDGENDLLYARMIAAIARSELLRPLNANAVARVLEESARLAEDSEKLSAHASRIVDLLREANHFAQIDQSALIHAAHVQEAVDARVFRADRVRERMQEEIIRDTVLVATEGAVVGQINGLSILQLGDFRFGRPTRITAQVRLGKGHIVDIEREVELGGPIHSKGVLILTGFLGARYATDHPLALSASLVFEQSYSGVEGDSATCAELYALLSAIANVPLNQSLAITGSMNQHGQVQAIGGVNEKIEGFYDLCAERGLTGEQGVLIPAANIKHLMLRARVLRAVQEGKFHIYPIQHIDEGIELLTGLPPGVRDSEGQYAKNTFNGRVQSKLADMAARLAEFGSRGQAGDEKV